MLCAVFAEVLFKTIGLLLTVYVAESLTTEYIEALIDATRAYITVIDLLYSQERLPLRT